MSSIEAHGESSRNVRPEHVQYENSTSFPRCEYKARFKGTSAFKMTTSKYWGTYFRSTKSGGNYNRLAELSIEEEKDVEMKKPLVPKKRTTRRSSSGIFDSPYRHPPYNLRKGKNDNTFEKRKQTPTIDYYLYDELISYRCFLCESFIKKYRQGKYFVAYYKNGYPCIMVKASTSIIVKRKKGESSLYKIIVAYFTAIANNTAFKQKIPIEMVIRASFGHNGPTVTATKNSFRINIGIVPKVYATNVLIESLTILNNEFPTILNENLSSFGDQIAQINYEINAYNLAKNNNSVEYWNSEDSLFNVLCKSGDSSGKTIAVQISRRYEYTDLLCDYVHDELFKKSTKPTAEPLRKLLQKLCFNTNEVTMNVNDDDYTKTYSEFAEEENADVKNDADFWSIMKKIASVISVGHDVNNRKIYGLNALIEKANFRLIESSENRCEDGYGSDSDYEGIVHPNSSDIKYHFLASKSNAINIFSKKIIVATGMRAISLSYSLAKCLIENKKECTRFMYYETCEAVKNAGNIENLNHLLKCKQNLLRFIDLNHCASTSEDRKVKLLDIRYDSAKAKETVIIFDYTSATSKKIYEAIQMFIPHVRLIILVNSGSKNEQIGADNNPYGTIRIISKEANILNQLYTGFIQYLDSKGDEQSPKRLHEIRKTYKSIGAVVTNKRIFQSKNKNLSKETQKL